MTPQATSWSQTSWAAVRRGGDDADGDAVLADHVRQLVDVPDGQPGDLLADPVRVGVEQRGDVEAAGGEAAVVGQRVAEVADPDQRDRPVPGQPEGAPMRSTSTATS